MNLFFLSTYSGLSDLLSPDAVGSLITSFLPSLLFCVISDFCDVLGLQDFGRLTNLSPTYHHYPWFPLELQGPFYGNENNLTCTCEHKTNKPKQ